MEKTTSGKKANDKASEKEQIITDLFALKLGMAATYERSAAVQQQLIQFLNTFRKGEKNGITEAIRSFLLCSPTTEQMARNQKAFMAKAVKVAEKRRKGADKQKQWYREHNKNIEGLFDDKEKFIQNRRACWEQQIETFAGNAVISPDDWAEARWNDMKGGRDYSDMQTDFRNMIEHGLITSMITLSPDMREDVTLAKSLAKDIVSSKDIFAQSVENYQKYLNNLDKLRDHLIANKESLSFVCYCYLDADIKSPKADIVNHIDAFINNEKELMRQIVQIMTMREELINQYMKLAKEYSYLLHEGDFASLDYIIYLFITKRSDTIKEALQLLDEERRMNRLVETVHSATNYLAENFKTIMNEFGSRLEVALKTIGSQLEALNITVQQRLGPEDISRQLNTSSQQMVNTIKTNNTQSNMQNSVPTEPQA